MPVPAVAPASTGGGGGVGASGEVVAYPTLALGSLELNRVDAYGIEWVCEDLAGWDGFATAGPLEEKSGAHGAAAGEAFITSKVMTLSGSFRAGSPAERRAATSRFLAGLPRNFDGTVLRVDEEPAKQLEVRVSGSPEVDGLDSRGTFSVGLVARDPRKYGTAVHPASASLPFSITGLVPPLTPPVLLPESPNGNQLSLTNTGLIPTGALMRIVGPVRAPQLTRQDTGQTLWWDVTVQPGDFLEVDTRLMGAWLSGTAYRAAGYGSSWWEVPPGGCVVNFNGEQVPGVDDLGSVTVQTRSAWL